MFVKNLCLMKRVHVSSKPHVLKNNMDSGGLVILLVQITSPVCSSWVACWQTEGKQCWQTGITDTPACCKSLKFLSMFVCTVLKLHSIYLWLCMHHQLDPLLLKAKNGARPVSMAGQPASQQTNKGVSHLWLHARTLSKYQKILQHYNILWARE